MSQQISAEDAQAHLPELIEAALHGETVLIASDGAVVQLIPVAQPKGARKAGSARGQIVMSDGFDAPLEDFAEYMQ